MIADGLRKKVDGILDLKVDWESVDVVSITEMRHVDDEEVKGVGRPVVLISMVWPTVGEGKDRKDVESLAPEVQQRCQEAVDATHALMCDHGMLDVHAEIKEGHVQVLNNGGEAKLRRHGTGQYERAPTLGHSIRLQTPRDFQQSWVVRRSLRPGVYTVVDEQTEECRRRWGSDGGSIFAYVRIRGALFAITPGHAAPRLAEQNKHPVVVTSDTRWLNSTLGKLVCSFENEVDGVTGALRDWALIKLDGKRFGEELPWNQAPILDIYRILNNPALCQLLSFNGVPLQRGAISVEATINSAKTDRQFFRLPHSTQIGFLSDINSPSTSPAEQQGRASPGTDTTEPRIAPPPRAGSNFLPKDTSIKALKYGRASGWTAGVLNEIASSIRVRTSNGGKATARCLLVLNYHPRCYGAPALFCEQGDSGAMVQTVGTHEADRREVVGMLVAGGGIMEPSWYPEYGSWDKMIETPEFSCQVRYVMLVGEMMEDIRVKLKLRVKETIDWC